MIKSHLTILKEVNDAIKYLATLDRVYSEHVRPRFGKRSALKQLAEEEIPEKKSGVMEALMVGDQAMRDYAYYLSQVRKLRKFDLLCGNVQCMSMWLLGYLNLTIV